MSSRYPLLVVFLFAALLRGGVPWVLRDNLKEDRDAYREIAENLATYRIYGLGKDGEPRPTAYRPPLYPVLLAKLAGEGLEVTPLRVALLHWLLGIGTVWLTWVTAGLLCREVDGGGTGAAWRPALAALVVACDPILLHWSTYVMTETLATFLAILALYTLTRFHFDRRPLIAAFAGCALGLAVLCRPTFLPWAGLCGLCLPILRPAPWPQLHKRAHWIAKQLTVSDPYTPRAAIFALYFLALFVVLSPWAYRNDRKFAHPIVTTTHGGYTFYLANNKYLYQYQRRGDFTTPWDSTNLDKLIVRDEFIIFRDDSIVVMSRPKGVPIEVFRESVLYALAIEDIRNDPLMFGYSCLYRICQLWSPLPNKLTADESWKRALLRYATCAWYLGVFAAAITGAWRLRGKLLRSPWVWGVLLCLVFTGVHTFYWSNLRMRAPLMPFVAIVAAVGAAYVFERVRGISSPRPRTAQCTKSH